MKVAVLDDYANVATTITDWSSLANADLTVFNDTLKDEAALIDRLKAFDVICMMRERTPFPATLLNALPNLKLLVTSGPRNLSIDLVAAKANNITVCGTESRKTTTSELSMLLMLSLSRGLIPEVNAMHSSGWQVGLGRDLNGLALGLIGLGKIGVQMATLGKAFGMQINAWSPNLTAERCEQHGVQFQSTLNNLMQSSDVVSVHMVLSDLTKHLVTAEAFANMRERALFINTSRGPLADETAIIAGMKQGKPWKAALDVFDEEPLPMNSPLRDKQLIEEGRLLLSPHLGYVTEQTWQVFYSQTVEAIAAWQAGNPVRELTLTG